MNILTIPAEEAKALVARCIARGIIPATVKPRGPSRPPKHPAPVVTTQPRRSRRSNQPTSERRTLADHYQVDISTISKWIKRGVLTKTGTEWTLKPRRRGAAPKYAWEKVDWTMRDPDIIKAIGCSKSAVDYQRRARRTRSALKP